MKEILGKIQPIFESLQRYSVTIAIVIVGAVYGYLIYTSSTLVQVEPSDAEVTERYQGTKRPKLDPVIAEKISELQDNNISFQALIDDARNNPFTE